MLAPHVYQVLINIAGFGAVSTLLSIVLLDVIDTDVFLI